jgi:hypothetical protein
MALVDLRLRMKRGWESLLIQTTTRGVPVQASLLLPLFRMHLVSKLILPRAATLGTQAGRESARMKRGRVLLRMNGRLPAQRKSEETAKL